MKAYHQLTLALGKEGSVGATSPREGERVRSPMHPDIGIDTAKHSTHALACLLKLYFRKMEVCCAMMNFMKIYDMYRKVFDSLASRTTIT